MRWMAPAHGIWVPKCEGHQAFTSKMGAIRYADYHDWPRLGQERFSGPRH
jgi:CTP synthase (UTP-ammonia lyase)